jgi:hypothetical protein
VIRSLETLSLARYRLALPASPLRESSSPICGVFGRSDRRPDSSLATTLQGSVRFFGRSPDALSRLSLHSNATSRPSECRFAWKAALFHVTLTSRTMGARDQGSPATPPPQWEAVVGTASPCTAGSMVARLGASRLALHPVPSADSFIASLPQAPSGYSGEKRRSAIRSPGCESGRSGFSRACSVPQRCPWWLLARRAPPRRSAPPSTRGRAAAETSCFSRYRLLLTPTPPRPRA